MLEDKLPNVSETTIEVRTNFNPQIEDGGDFREQVIREFHDAVHYWIDKQLTDNETFEEEIVSILADRGELPENVKEFLDLGQIIIRVSQSKDVQVNQKNLLDDQEIEEYLNKENLRKAGEHPNQRKL